MVHGPHSVQRVADASGGQRFSSQEGLNESPRNLTGSSRGSERFVNRAIAPGGPNASSPSVAALPQGAAEAKRPRSSASDIDVSGVVDQVYQMLVSRLASERLRKGL
jgi:hypothetical protein